MKIGPYQFSSKLFLAPMAGITDRPYREICRRYGAGLTVSEMITSDESLFHTKKTQQRLLHRDEAEPRSVQIVGTEPEVMANAARYNSENGANIIDINMGCPAKKVCNVMAGSALLKNEALVADILDAVVKAVDIPVTLKIRTGWDKENRNAIKVAQIAEQAGIQSLAVHGRTRACGYSGEAEYDTIAAIKTSVNIPVIANGDIRTPEQAKYVLDYTGANAVMIGRAALGKPWIFREIDHFLTKGEHLAPPSIIEIRDVLLEHLENLYQFYGEYTGVRMARKHLSWYSKGQRYGANFRQVVNKVDTCAEQVKLTQDFFDQLI